MLWVRVRLVGLFRLMGRSFLRFMPSSALPCLAFPPLTLSPASRNTSELTHATPTPCEMRALSVLAYSTACSCLHVRTLHNSAQSLWLLIALFVHALLFKLPFTCCSQCCGTPGVWGRRATACSSAAKVCGLHGGGSGLLLPIR